MTELLVGIKAAFTGAVATAFPGGLWPDQAPAGTAMPYLVYSVVAAPVQVAYPGIVNYVATIRFSAYGLVADCGPAGTAFAAADAVYGASFSVTGKTIDCFLPGSKGIPRYMGKDGQQNDVWQTSATYDYSVS